MTGPGFEQRAVDREVLVGQQTVGFDRGQHFREERVGDVAVEQPIAILRKRGRVPDRIVQAQADKPPVRML